MPIPYFAKPHGNADKTMVEAAYRTASTGQLKERLLMVLLSLEGYRASAIASIVHRDVDTVLHWLHCWNEFGFTGLYDRPYSGRPPILTSDEEEKMVSWVLDEVSSGRRLTCRQIAAWVKETFGKSIDEESVRRILHKHKYSWQKPGTKDHRADPKAQAEFSQQLEQRMKDEPNTRFFFSDEAIFRLSTTTTYTWGKQGERSMIKTNLSHEKIIEIGAIEPLTGENFHLFVPETTKESYSIFLDEFAKAFPDEKIVFIHDGASWHNVPSPSEDIELWALPPYSPQLNPIERLWHWIRDNFTHNKFFTTIKELEQALIKCLKDEVRLKQAILSVCTIN